ncbi:polysaccharide deacetylase family protein [Nonomuraea africana]|uniref:Peptidoglycan/xylan/chitin deacetylase (PgdA/CDA1 family) n=1 Tax=Nonomuraea africana TaxID=46171 RepID=A0ABR9KVL0_9ACTN|nr:polysaccharide deacetylase family protein [Nonomuraea africana]MBE1565557.1 peptidoglycan/xylan/chitin deacetylase (PgdA/CDA1 family) [Nonomuraea africana]
MRVLGAGLVAIGALAAGCGGGGSDTTVAKPQVDNAAVLRQAKAAKVAAAAKVKANELGQVPVIMFHRVVDKPTTQDDRTPAQFRADLERLVKDGYVPVTAAEYAMGKIDIPAGKHAVVLTFDDSSPSQLTLDELGQPKQGTAVQILQDVAKRNPGFRAVGTFYVTRDMFGKSTLEEQAQMVLWLKQNGFDIGNHTRDHLNLAGKPQKAVVEEIAAGHKLITALDGPPPATLALPYGNQPRKKDWARTGKSGGVTYNHAGVFLAGYTPAPAPFNKNFDPLGIPRIRAMDKKGDCAQFCSTAWLDWLNQNADQRYTSDGDPQTVAYPKFKAPFLRKHFAARALPY